MPYEECVPCVSALTEPPGRRGGFSPFSDFLDLQNQLLVKTTPAKILIAHLPPSAVGDYTVSRFGFAVSVPGVLYAMRSMIAEMMTCGRLSIRSAL